MYCYFMVISYDGSGYSGWQRQSVGNYIKQNSIQAVLEKGLKTVLGERILIDGAGRTDAGVHAFGQTASFKTDNSIPPDKFRFALNRVLPSDIYVKSLVPVPDDFHARYSAIGKTYEYRLYTDKDRNPFLSKQMSFVLGELDEDKIRQAMQYFMGKHDFKTYMASGSKVKNTVREITSFDLMKSDNQWCFLISGDGFLYHMVRIIIGTLINVGKGNICPDSIPDIIKSGDRSRAKDTASPEGLYLLSVQYPDNFL